MKRERGKRKKKNSINKVYISVLEALCWITEMLTEDNISVMNHCKESESSY